MIKLFKLMNKQMNQLIHMNEHMNLMKNFSSKCQLSSPNVCFPQSSASLSLINYSSFAINENYCNIIPAQEFRDRQLSIVKQIDKCSYHKHKSSILLIPSAVRTFQADTKIPQIHYKQNAEFTYFTGFTNHQSSDCVFVIIGGNGDAMKSYLFVPKANPSQQLWDGTGIRDDHMQWISKICDNIFDAQELDNFINLQNGNRQIFVPRSALNGNGNGNGNSAHSMPSNGDTQTVMLNGTLGKLKNLNTKPLNQLSSYIDHLRLIKSPKELDAMRRTCIIGSHAMLETIKWTKSMTYDNLIHESQISAKFEFETRINGARKLAFPTVCGSGRQTTVIHYGINNQFALPTDWVLMDGGCEDYDGYSSDITRTWPIDGNYSKNRLRYELYDALCDVQQNLFKSLEQDPVMSLDTLFQLMLELLGKLLIEFKAIDRSLGLKEAATLAYRYCPHHVSHYLGLDIHDCPTVSRNVRLKPGMCFTVEPGLYFPENDLLIKPEFKGIGMRIEDDLAVNYDGQIEVLTRHCPHILKNL